MDVIERFKQRKNLAAILDVYYPTEEDPTLILKVARFSQVERNAAQRDAFKLMREQGLEPKEMTAEDFETRYPVQYCEALAKYVERHVKNWEHKPKDGGEPAPFTTGYLKAVIASFDPTELMMLGAGYLKAEKLDEKKNMSQENSDKDSSSA